MEETISRLPPLLTDYVRHRLSHAVPLLWRLHPILVFQHANVRLSPSLDRALAWLIVTPGMHLVHHSRVRREADSNYSTFLTLWDHLFGSFRPALVPSGLGVDGLDKTSHQTIFGLLATPWR